MCVRIVEECTNKGMYRVKKKKVEGARGVMDETNIYAAALGQKILGVL